MTRDDAIRASRAQSFDSVFGQWVTPASPTELAAARARYVADGWRPDKPKVLWERGTATSMKPNGN